MSQTTSKPPRYTFYENMLLQLGFSPENNKQLRQLGLDNAIELKGGKRKASRRKLTASRHKRRASRRKRYTCK
jgi:hypothetical protein